MAKMPAQKPGRSKQDYATPRIFLDAVKHRLQITEFSHDFAADQTNTVATTYFDEEYDSLRAGGVEWHDFCDGVGEWGWLNPPFSRIGPWAQACNVCAQASGNIALLVPAAVGSNWFRDYVHGQARVLFLNGRLAFMPDKPTWLYPKDCVLCLYGPRAFPGYEVWDWRKELLND